MTTIRPEIADLAQPLSKATPHPRNVRQGDIGAICQSLEAHGQYRPIVVHKSTGHVLAGNHTYQAAQALGWKKIAMTFVDCDEEQALRILLVDNRANDLAIYDDDALADLLKELDASGGLQGTLFDGDDLDDLLFRISGTLGTGHATLSATEALEAYEGRDTKSVVLPYSTADYRDIMEKCNKLRSEHGFDSNSELVANLINKAHASI